MNEPILKIQGVSKVFGRVGRQVHALCNVDLMLYAGETLAVVGESGSGKTTLANLLLGLDHASEGEISYQNVPLTKRRDRDLRRAIQLVQQNPTTTLNPRRTIEQSVGL